MRTSLTATAIAALAIWAATFVTATDFTNAAELKAVPAQSDISLPLVIPAQNSGQSQNGVQSDQTVQTNQSISGTTDAVQLDSGTVQEDEPVATLAALVDRLSDDDAGLDTQAHCLATAIYYEARGESLAGQLAVARVVVNRANSGRFPGSLCGVVTQPGQFGFVRGGHLPDTPGTGRSWRDAVAIAQIAQNGSWKSSAEGALYFHSARVAPGWGRTRMAQIDNHVFYR